jgi:hypothetical protein
MKRITFNIDDELFAKLGDDKTEVNKKALAILIASFEPKPTESKESIEEHWILKNIKGYLENEDNVYLEVLSNRHGRRSRRIKMDDL